MTDLPATFGRGHGDLEEINTYLNASGARAYAIFRQGGNYSEGNRIQVGTDTLEVVRLNDNSGAQTRSNDFNSTADPLIVDMSDYAQLISGGTHELREGELIEIETEILRLVKKDGNTYSFARGQMGSATAAHASGNNIVIDNNFNHATRIPVCDSSGAALTAEGIGDAVRVAVNEGQGDFTNGGLGPVSVVETAGAGAELVFVLNHRGEDTRAVSETGSNSTFQSTTFVGGEKPRTRRSAFVSRVPTAAEVTAGRIVIPVDFTVGGVFATVTTTATGAISAWDGDISTVTGADLPDVVVLNNDGSTDWAATSTVDVLIIEE